MQSMSQFVLHPLSQVQAIWNLWWFASQVIFISCAVSTIIPLLMMADSSLYRILKELKPSQWKSSAWLVSTTADGLNGLSILADIVKNYFAGNKGILWATWKGENDILKLDTPSSIVLIILLVHATLYLFCFIQLLQIYARRDNVVLKITILFATNALIYIQP